MMMTGEVIFPFLPHSRLSPNGLSSNIYCAYGGGGWLCLLVDLPLKVPCLDLAFLYPFPVCSSTPTAALCCIMLYYAVS